jgi:TPR repeat protein/AcrR family transcriptional regulator
MTEDLTRARIVDIARSLILKHGSRFTTASLCVELGCTRSNLRSHFPTKSDLVTAVFDGSSTEITTEPVTKVIGAKPHSANTGSAESEWIERRFRVFERAIATLEREIEGVRQNNTKSVARLEKKMSTVAKNSHQPKAEASTSNSRRDKVEAHYIEIERNHFAAMSVADLEAAQSPAGNLSSSRTNFGRTSQVHDKPPLIDTHEGEMLTAGIAPKSSCGLEGELQFTTKPDETEREKDGWKELSIFGATAFVTLLVLVGSVIVLTTHAGASHTVSDKALGRVEHAHEAALSKKPEHLANIFPERRSQDAAAVLTPVSIASSLTAKALGLENFLPNESTTLDQAASGDPKAKLKLALTFAKGAGVKADPMMAVFWSEAAAQQGDADAQFGLGTLYDEGIKPDPAQAFKWFSSAAVGGNQKAMHNIAIALLNGVGVAKDQASATHWFVRAANLGYRDSAFDLGVLYEQGQGVAQNSQTALSWYDKAAATGDQQAANRAALLRSNGLSASNGD